MQHLLDCWYNGTQTRAHTHTHTQSHYLFCLFIMKQDRNCQRRDDYNRSFDPDMKHKLSTTQTPFASRKLKIALCNKVRYRQPSRYGYTCQSLEWQKIVIICGDQRNQRRVVVNDALRYVCCVIMSPRAHLPVVMMLRFMFLTDTNRACPLLFILFFRLFLSLWSFQLYFIL